MTYYAVSKVGKKGWGITKVSPGWMTAIASHYPTRKAALTAARLLAGWRCQVVVR